MPIDPDELQPRKKPPEIVLGEDIAMLSAHELENRIAALLAMGIWPFDQASFSSANVQDSSSEANAIKSVLKNVLGYTV